jgi:uncharacterized membrane protein
MSEPIQNRSEASTDGIDPATLSDASRWLAALSYAFVMVIFVLYETKRRPPDPYVRFHARQGFVLFFVQFVLLVVTTILRHTVGNFDVSGAVIMVTWELLFGLLAVGISVMGFMYGLSGEMWRMPVLGQYANRVPLS